MSGADVLLAVLAMGVAVLLARGSHPLVQLLLVASALAVSAILFLPTAMLADLIGMPRVHRLYGFTRGTPLDPPEWIHVAAFAWLGGLVWLARPGWRTWPGAGGAGGGPGEVGGRGGGGGGWRRGGGGRGGSRGERGGGGWRDPACPWGPAGWRKGPAGGPAIADGKLRPGRSLGGGKTMPAL